MTPEEKQNLQTNILHPHRKDHVKCIFIKFEDGLDPNDIREWIGGWAAKFQQNNCGKNVNILFSAMQSEMAFNQSQLNEKDVDVCFFLTTFLYQKLNMEQPSDPAFQRGMNAQATIEVLREDDYFRPGEYRNGNIDIMIMFASNKKKSATRIIRNIRDSLAKGIGTPLTQEYGKVIRKKGTNDTFEPFGFKDCISKSPDPIIHALVPEVGHANRWGSYFVFKKLEQNKALFNKSIDALRKKGGISKEYAEAQVIGRYKNGVPVMFKNQMASSGKIDHELIADFDSQKVTIEDIEKKPGYSRCPFHAHIRKVNEKPGSPKVEIIRRAIPYKQKKHSSVGSITNEGLLFMCYQKSIANQFEVIQGKFSMGINHPQQGIGFDSLSKNEKNDKSKFEQNWLRDNGSIFNHYFEQTVWFVGGEYFYAPSIPFLIELSSPPA